MKTDTGWDVGSSMKLHIALPDRQIAGESCWAIYKGDDLCEVNNIPFFHDQFSVDDIVRFQVVDGIAEFVEVVEKKTEVWGIEWEPTPGDEQSEWSQIIEHLKANEIRRESMTAGVFVVVFPADLSEKEQVIRLKALCYSSPIALKPCISRVDGRTKEIPNNFAESRKSSFKSEK